jgi:hypothetical protein
MYITDMSGFQCRENVRGSLLVMPSLLKTSLKSRIDNQDFELAL